MVLTILELYGIYMYKEHYYTMVHYQPCYTNNNKNISLQYENHYYHVYIYQPFLPQFSHFIHYTKNMFGVVVSSRGPGVAALKVASAILDSRFGQSPLERRHRKDVGDRENGVVHSDLVGGLEHELHFPYIGNVVIPID